MTWPRLLTLLAAVAIITALLAALLYYFTTGSGREARGAKPVNLGTHELVSRPDLHPPSLSVTLKSQAATPGYYFVTQGSPLYGNTGPMIVDGTGAARLGRAVPDGENATTFEVQRYQGRPVLTWWEGRIDRDVGMGIGKGVILDERYRRVATVHAGNGRPTDLHDFVITSRDTALLLIYQRRTANLSEYGGSANGCRPGQPGAGGGHPDRRVLFEWSAFDNVPPDESYKESPPMPAPGTRTT